MTINETSPKLKAAITLAKVRGYKELREDQMALLRELLSLDQISVTEALNEVLDAPQERFNRTVKNTRKHASNALFRLASILNNK
jgi:hypothetical protein